MATFPLRPPTILVQVLDEELLKDTHVVYLRSFDEKHACLVSAPSEQPCITVMVYDGNTRLYVTFDEHSLCGFNFRLPPSTKLNKNRSTKHPLVGAELLITISAQDIYGCFCQDLELLKVDEESNATSYRLGDPLDEHAEIRIHHHVIRLIAQHVEFIQFGPLPRFVVRDAMAPSYAPVQVDE